jgi:hypothetical protein
MRALVFQQARWLSECSREIGWFSAALLELVARVLLVTLPALGVDWRGLT